LIANEVNCLYKLSFSQTHDGWTRMDHSSPSSANMPPNIGTKI